VAPPLRPGGYALRFATNDAVKGWDALCQQAASNTRTAYDAIEAEPARRPIGELLGAPVLLESFGPRTCGRRPLLLAA
jgi:hypothetical protein